MNNGSISTCYSDSNGSRYGDSTTQVDGETTTWDDAKENMNSVLATNEDSGSDYEYVVNTDNRSSLPLMIIQLIRNLTSRECSLLTEGELCTKNLALCKTSVITQI